MKHIPTLQRGLTRHHLLVILSVLAVSAIAAFFILRSSAPNALDRELGPAKEQEVSSHAADDKSASDEAHEQGDQDKHDHAAEQGQAPSMSTSASGEAKADHDDEVIAMSESQIKVAEIELATSGPAVLQTVLTFPGEVKFNEDRSAHIVPRTSGVVEAVHVELGQRVRKGQVLAEVSSISVSDLRSELRAAQQRLALARSTFERENKLWQEQISPEQDVQQARQTMREAEISVANAQQKLQTLGADRGASSGSLGRMPLRAPFDGIVVEKHLTLGEAVQESTNAFTVSDLSTVWAEMNVPARDIEHVRVGEPALVRSGASGATAQGSVAYVGMLIGEQTRTAPARVTLANPKNAWRPGLFVNVEVTTGEGQAPVTVSETAIQSLEGKSVVFLRVADGFKAQPVVLGRKGKGRVEITQGLKAGETYAAKGSFTVKAEQGKAEASHTH